MSFMIDFIGLAYFLREPESRLVLLPDGRTPEAGIAPHYAGFVLESAKVYDAARWWPVRQNKTLEDNLLAEYPISEPSCIEISGLEKPAGAPGCSPFKPSALDARREGGLVNLNKSAPSMHIDPKRAQTIAQLRIAQGRIETFLMMDWAVTRLTIPNHTGGVTIKATTRTGDEKFLVVRDETEIVLSNTSDILSPKRYEETLLPYKSHFRIYANIPYDGDPDKLVIPTTAPKLAPFPSSHPYILLVEGHHVPGADCGNTCSNC